MLNFIFSPEISPYIEVGLLISLLITLLIALAKQITFHQSKLYYETKQQMERGEISKNVINIIRSSLELNTVLKNVCNELLKIFNVQRIFIGNLNFKKREDFIEVVRNFEIKKSSNVDEDIFNIMADYWINYINTYKTTKVINDIEKSDMPDNVKNIYKNIMKVKSIICVPIKSREEIWGGLFLSSSDNYINLSSDEINFLEEIAAQLDIAIKQAKLYENERQAVQKELILRKIIETIRSSIDLDFVKHEMVFQIGNFLKADRVAFADYNSQKGNYFISQGNEYRSSENVKTFVDYNFAGTPGFIESIRKLHLTGKDIIFDDLDEYLEKNNLKNTGIENFYRDMGFMSSMAINIYYGESFYGNLVVTFEEKREITDSEVKFVKSLADQAGIALYQSTLYLEQKQSLEREKILRETIQILRSTLDLEEIKKYFVEITCDYFDADRCLFVDYDRTKEEFLTFEIEKLKSPEFKSLIGVSVEEDFPEFAEKLKKRGRNIIIKDLKKTLSRVKLSNYKSILSLHKSDAKSDYGLVVKYKDEIMGILIIHFIVEKRILNSEKMAFLKILRDQVGIALYHAELYQNERKTANRERILKDIISEIKLTRDLNQAYNKLLGKLAEIFDLNRTLFLESSEINPEELNIKYEYVIKREDMGTNNIIFPQVCIEAFLNLIHNLQPLILNDVNECYPTKTADFFKKYKIQALLSFPLIKYSKEIQVLGFIVLCSEKKRIWTDEEIELMKAISDSVVSVIWEIAKFIETEELRDSFVSTLAHDFQVPLVGEKTALEYILNYSDIKFGKNRKILEEMLENNQNITEILARSVDIYNYESGKKNLNLITYKLTNILNEAILLSKSYADSKNIKINFEKLEEQLFIETDKKELLKVFTILLENAINYSPERGEIQIEYHRKNSRVIINVHNKGKPIPQAIQEKIFNRYEMAQAIERKIGAGTGLFLSKRIVEAHKGAIWFDSDEIEGTTFHVSLPLIMEK